MVGRSSARFRGSTEHLLPPATDRGASRPGQRRRGWSRTSSSSASMVATSRLAPLSASRGDTRSIRLLAAKPLISPPRLRGATRGAAPVGPRILRPMTLTEPRFGAQSMTADLREVLVARPGSAFGRAFENPAHGFLRPVDLGRARRQHDGLVATLEELGAKVEVLDAETGDEDLD